MLKWWSTDVLMLNGVNIMPEFADWAKEKFFGEMAWEVG
jgi:hypothetical protein